ncbi:DNA repair protein rad13 [Schizosaccharomyces pombe]
MGVSGLWNILEPVKRPVKLETLVNKRLAIDASIWIYQFLKAVRDKEGNQLKSSHVVGFFRRICKLLFFGIKPVFVFDGGAPSLKRQTIQKRQARRLDREENATVTANKLLALQMRHQAMLLEENNKKATALANASVQNERQMPSSMTLDNSEIKPVLNQRKNYLKPDPYQLPEMDVSFDKLGSSYDPRIMSQDELTQYVSSFTKIEDINLFDFSNIDFDSELFQSLPDTDKYSILSAARLRSRLRMGLSSEQLSEMFPNRMDFSRFQIERLKERNDLTQRLMDFTGMNEFGPSRVVSEKNREYILVKNEGAEGGWALGVISGSTNNEPIIIDDEATKLSSNLIDEDEDEAFYDVPLPSRSHSMNPRELVAAKLKEIKENSFSENQQSDEADYNVTDDLMLQLATQQSLEENKKSKELFSLSASEFDKLNSEKKTFEILSTDIPAEDSMNSLLNDEENLKLEHVGDVSNDSLAFAEKKHPENGTSIFMDALPSASREKKTNDSIDPLPFQPMDWGKSIFFEKLKKPTETFMDSKTDIPSEAPDNSKLVEDTNLHTVNATVSIESDLDAAKPGIENPIISPLLPVKDDEKDLDLRELNPLEPFENMKEQADDGTATNPLNVSSDKAMSVYLLSSENAKDTGDIKSESIDAVLPTLETSSPSLSIPTDFQKEASPNKGAAALSPKVEPEVVEKLLDEEEEEMIIRMAEEEKEYDRFVSELNQRPETEEWNQEAFEKRLKELKNQKRSEKRDADEVTQVMIKECQELLRLFGLPYIVAPQEAEAQCSKLLELKLVDGIVTDDSDVFLFGGTRVYRNMFNQNKFVELYLMDDMKREFNVNQMDLIKLAHLLGSDYTMGLSRVGPVLALEILHEFPGDTGLFEFKKWFQRLSTGHSSKNDVNTPVKKRINKLVGKIILPSEFPNPLVDEAYLHPAVDDSKQSFQWGIPDLDELRQFLMATVGWSKQRTNEVLLPVIQDMHKKQFVGTQSNLTQFFEGGNTNVYAPRVAYHFKSKRLENALSSFKNQISNQSPMSEEIQADADAFGESKGSDELQSRILRRKKMMASKNSSDSDSDSEDNFLASLTPKTNSSSISIENLSRKTKLSTSLLKKPSKRRRK